MSSYLPECTSARAQLTQQPLVRASSHHLGGASCESVQCEHRCHVLGLRALGESARAAPARRVLEWLNVAVAALPENENLKDQTSENDLDFALELDDKSLSSPESLAPTTAESEKCLEIWPELLQKTSIWWLAGQSPDDGGAPPAEFRGDTGELLELIRGYPALAPLAAQTSWDLPLSAELAPLIAEFSQVRNFSVESWLDYRDLTELQLRALISPLLKIKVCHLLREVQLELDRGEFTHARPILKRQFANIPDELAKIYAPGQNNFRYHSLLQIIAAFVREYRGGKRISTTSISPLVARYISQVYQERALLDRSESTLLSNCDPIAGELESPRAVNCPTSSPRQRHQSWDREQLSRSSLLLR